MHPNAEAPAQPGSGPVLGLEVPVAVEDPPALVARRPPGWSQAQVDALAARMDQRLLGQ